jgi:hypothetical protein
MSSPIEYPFSIPITATLRPDAAILRTSSGVSARPILSGRQRLGQSMNGVKLRNRLLIRAVEALRRQRALAHVHDHERHVEPAFDHLGQIHLRGQAHRVVAVGREIAGTDVVVRVHRDDTLVDRPGSRDERRIRLLRGGAGANRRSDQRDRGTGNGGSDEQTLERSRHGVLPGRPHSTARGVP